MKKTLQTSDFKTGQKVWVDNLEKDRLEKWIVKAVTINSVTTENKKSKETFRFYEKGGQFLLKNRETNLVSHVLYTKRRKAKKERRKRRCISIREWFFFVGLMIGTLILEWMQLEIPYLYFIQLCILTVMNMKFFFNVFILNQGKKFGGDKDYIVFNLTFLLELVLIDNPNTSMDTLFLISGGIAYVLSTFLWLFRKLLEVILCLLGDE